MIKISKTALLPYSASQLYELVLQVTDYPLFLPWCSAAVVHEQNESFQDASIQIQKGPLKEQFRTHNILVPGQMIRMQLVEGPFKALSGVWEFLALGNEGAQISLHLEFEIKLGPMQTILEATFKQVTQSMLQAFCQRAHEIYHVGREI